MSNWICYILKNTVDKYKNLTYNGATVNITRRLRQHNGEITGGAKFTRGRGNWEVYCIISGFKTKVAALQAEWRIKRVEGRRRPRKYSGPNGRIDGVNKIFQLKQFTKNCVNCIADQHLSIFIMDEYSHQLIDIPDHIVIESLEAFYTLPIIPVDLVNV